MDPVVAGATMVQADRPVMAWPATVPAARREDYMEAQAVRAAVIATMEDDMGRQVREVTVDDCVSMTVYCG